MTANTPDAPSDKLVRIFHTGKGHGPMSTAGGDLLPGSFIDVTPELAAKLTGAYKHIRLASDVIPGGASDPRVARENAMLKAELEKLSKELALVNEEGPKAIAAAKEEAEAAHDRAAKAELALAESVPADVAVLKAALAEFLKPGSKKELEALQEKHKDILA